MATTYEPIQTTTLTSAQSSITFSSIPSTYTDLRVVWVGTNTTGSSEVRLRFNSDTGTNYSQTALSGNGSSATSGRLTSQTLIYLTWGNSLNGTLPAFKTVDVFSYTGSTYKTVLSTESTDRNGSGSVVANVGLWRSTSTITSIELSVDTNNFATGTTATLYGIKAA